MGRPFLVMPDEGMEMSVRRKVTNRSEYFFCDCRRGSEQDIGALPRAVISRCRTGVVGYSSGSDLIVRFEDQESVRIAQLPRKAQPSSSTVSKPTKDEAGGSRPAPVATFDGPLMAATSSTEAWPVSGPLTGAGEQIVFSRDYTLVRDAAAVAPGVI